MSACTPLLGCPELAEVEIDGPVDRVHAEAPLAPDFARCREKLAEIGEALTLDVGDDETEEPVE